MCIKIKTILRKLLTDNDITAAQLARATKVPPQTINNWLNGVNPKNLVHLKAVSNHFKVSVDYLVYGETSSKQDAKQLPFRGYEDEINAGIFEVVLRRVKK